MWMFCPYINAFGLQVILSRIHLTKKQTTKNSLIFADFLAKKNDGGFHGNGSTNKKNYILTFFTQLYFKHYNHLEHILTT